MQFHWVFLCSQIFDLDEVSFEFTEKDFDLPIIFRSDRNLKFSKDNFFLLGIQVVDDRQWEFAIIILEIILFDVVLSDINKIFTYKIQSFEICRHCFDSLWGYVKNAMLLGSETVFFSKNFFFV